MRIYMHKPVNIMYVNTSHRSRNRGGRGPGGQGVGRGACAHQYLGGGPGQPNNYPATYLSQAYSIQ